MSILPPLSIDMPSSPARFRTKICHSPLDPTSVSRLDPPQTVDSMSFDEIAKYLEGNFSVPRIQARFSRKRHPDDAKEPILTPSVSRFVLTSTAYPDIFDHYVHHRNTFWVPTEIDMSDDMLHWKTLEAPEREFILMIHAFFAGSDGIINENIVTNFAQEVQIPEARAFYTVQAMMETIHSETYTMILETLETDPDNRAKLLSAIDTYPCIRKKAEWALKWMGDYGAPFAFRIAAFAIVEGIFFSGAFCAIFWLKDRGLMPGLTFANELISRDEGLHTDFAVSLHSRLIFTSISPEAFEKILREAVAIETEFIVDAIPCKMIGMNAKLMTQYIEFVADRLALQFGFKEVYGSTCPFDFMIKQSIPTRTNFFERRVSEYSLAGRSSDRSLAFVATNDF